MMCRGQSRLAVAAGFLAGEGCFRIDKKRPKQGGSSKVYPHYGPSIRAGQVDREPLDLLQALFGGTTRLQRHDGNPRHQPMYLWQIGGSHQVLDCLRRIRRYLPTKKSQADLLIRLCHLLQERSRSPGSKTNPQRALHWEEYEELYQAAKRLNRKGGSADHA